ncbi:unnamed protein product [Caenorhabditis auriculariae]|uniref:Uncharacterized protein n=1 Tax=Caenorhabditis auriculariae TaxID=2777116 RepID=A0A8S1H3Y9_9PELO|nr:unnamed protein product [Caenorhabditis auriculariae]
MASSRGRERMRQKPQRQFAFGSSTPRDLSHLSTVPPEYRSYDARIEVVREGPELKEYILKARSVSRDVTNGRNWAFGSSTPRDLAHLVMIPPHQRIYNAKIPKKSPTAPEFKASTKRSTTAPPVGRQPSIARPAGSRFSEKDEEVSSEPDFIQDREEFVKAMKEEFRKRIKNIKNDDEQKPEEPISETSLAEPKVVDNVNFTRAAEIAPDPRKSMRIRADTHDEDGQDALQSRAPVQKMDDQITVSELNESTPATEIVVNEAGETTDLSNQTTVSNTTAIVDDLLKRVENVAVDDQETDENRIKLSTSEKHAH